MYWLALMQYEYRYARRQGMGRWEALNQAWHAMHEPLPF